MPERADDVRAFLAERHPEQAKLALWLRGVVRGAEPDRERLLQGEGRGRFVPVTTTRSVSAETLARYVTEAVAQRLFRP